MSLFFDDFRTTGIKIDMSLFNVQESITYNKYKYTVFERSNDFRTPVFESNSIKEIIQWL